MSEEWRIIPHFPQYAASSLGQIKRIAPDLRRHKVTGRPLKCGINRSGYASVTICADGKKINQRVNRIICTVFHGPPPTQKHHAAHNDGNRLNNRADNLRWALASDNEADKRRHGTAAIGEKHWSKLMPDRRARGEGHGRTKLNAYAIKAIRCDTRKQREIAADFQVSQRTIWAIKNKTTWSHIV